MAHVRLEKIYAQPNDCSCGPASLKTLLEYEGGKKIELSIRRLEKMAGTKKKVGTRSIRLRRIAAKLGFRIGFKVRSSLRDLEKSLKHGHPVLVGYIIPENGIPHYSVVYGITKKNVLIASSEEGKPKIYCKKVFRKAWYAIKRPGVMITFEKK